MNVLITGASGFLGRYVVAAALRAGHQVRALIRPKTDATRFAWHTHPRVTLFRADLRQRPGLAEALAGMDAVIHLAATKGGDFYERFAGTVIGTENLLWAMAAAPVHRLVVTSTFSVYDYQALPPGSLLDETAPLEAQPDHRDAYAETKLIQEDLVRTFAQELAAQVTILRPGMVYGRECLWHALLGTALGDRRWLQIGGRATLPLIYVENCAAAIAQALTAPVPHPSPLNLVDDDLPIQQQYINALRQREAAPPQIVSVNWGLMQAIARTAWWINQHPLQGQARLPGILVPAQLQARFRPLRYSNQLAKEHLGWTPQYSLTEALDRSYSDVDLLQVTPDQRDPTAMTSSAGGGR